MFTGELQFMSGELSMMKSTYLFGCANLFNQKLELATRGRTYDRTLVTHTRKQKQNILSTGIVGWPVEPHCYVFIKASFFTYRR
jgi:hypothetical protein